MSVSAENTLGMARTLNLEFLDLLVARMELLLELRTFERYGAPQMEVPDGDFTQVLEPLRQQMAAVEKRMDAVRADCAAESIGVRFDQLAQAFGLDGVEQEILMLALAPMLDTSFRKRIARFKDNILLDYCDVDLCLSLLFETRRGRLAAVHWFGESGRLATNGLIEFVLPKDVASEHQMAYELRVPGRVVNFVLGVQDIDQSLTGYAQLLYPQIPLEHVVLPEGSLQEVLGLADQFAGRLRGEGRNMSTALGPVDRGAVLQFCGPAGTGKTHCARAMASYLEAPILEVDCGKLAQDEHRFKGILEALFWQARLLGAVLVLDQCEAVLSERNPKLPAVFREFERWVGLAVLCTNEAKKIDDSVGRWVLYQFEFELPEMLERERLWKIHMPETPPPSPEVNVEFLASQYELSGNQIRNAALVAANMALADSEGDACLVKPEHFKRAAHTQMRASLSQYARRSKVSLTLDDLILPDAEKQQISSILEAAKHRTFVMTKWGFGRKLTTGKGLVAMFCGEPGTGKTLCAEIMAHELGLQLYQISIPQVMSKYIGETEKNIAQIFHTAKANHAMLLFDEADSLFTSRVKVESSVDKFSNMETNLLLQEIERFEGVIILTTNLDKSIDKAFQRRIQFKVTFPFPEAEDRAQIWKLLFPKECPLAEEIDWDQLGKSFEISGGHIKNAVLRAAYRAACTDGKVTMNVIQYAAEQECKQAGKLFRTFRTDDY